jgi:hypothetical protein
VPCRRSASAEQNRNPAYRHWAGGGLLFAKGRLEFKAQAGEQAVLDFEDAEPPGEFADLLSSLSPEFRLALSQERQLSLMGNEAGSIIGHFTALSGSRVIYYIILKLIICQQEP